MSTPRASYAPKDSSHWVEVEQEHTPVYVHHKILPIKHADGEPLTRSDIQFDLLQAIFTDNTQAFTDQSPDKKRGPPGKVTFCELYVNAILNSPKCTKVARDKMLETPSYAVEFAKMCLLVNVGRINTTLAFYHEMRTILRSYHPVPSLMKTPVSERNMMDAPRMKACLKGCRLPHEKNNAPATPAEILKKITQGSVPPTSVVNLVFVLANHVTPFSRLHFDPSIDFLDLFIPINISSAHRAKAFLWTVFHYLEGPEKPNPFNDDYAAQHPGKAPWLPRISKEQMEAENVDTVPEKEFAAKMKHHRIEFLKYQAAEEETIKKVEEPKYMAGRQQSQQQPSSSTQPAQQYNYQNQQPSGSQRKRKRVPSSSVDISEHRQFGTNSPSPGPSVHSTYSRYPPLEFSPISTALRPVRAPSALPESSSFLQQTWNALSNTDPFADSDEEEIDERVKLDYERRLYLLNRIRGKEPTPEPEPGPDSEAQHQEMYPVQQAVA